MNTNKVILKIRSLITDYIENNPDNNDVHYIKTRAITGTHSKSKKDCVDIALYDGKKKFIYEIEMLASIYSRITLADRVEYVKALETARLNQGLLYDMDIDITHMFVETTKRSLKIVQ